MKKERGVSLIVAVLIIAVVILVACAIVGVIIGMNNRKAYKENIVQNQEIVTPIVNDTPKTQNKTVVNEVVTEKPVEELVFTEEYLQSGQSYGNVNIINNRIENIIELSITGKSENGIDEFDKVSTKNRWYKTIDLTDYKTLQFYARKGEEQGDLMICIDDTLVMRVRYSELTSTWSKYTLDVSKYKGNHTLAFAGGYADNTGSEASNTQYSRIKLK